MSIFYVLAYAPSQPFQAHSIWDQIDFLSGVLHKNRLTLRCRYAGVMKLRELLRNSGFSASGFFQNCLCNNFFIRTILCVVLRSNKGITFVVKIIIKLVFTRNNITSTLQFLVLNVKNSITNRSIITIGTRVESCLRANVCFCVQIFVFSLSLVQVVLVVLYLAKILISRTRCMNN